MSGKQPPRNWLRDGQRSFDEFVETLLGEMSRTCGAPPDLITAESSPYLDTLVRWMIKRAAENKDAVVYAIMLQGWLTTLGIEAPTGVFIRNYHQKQGRPKKTELARSALELASAGLPYSKVASVLIPTEFKKNRKRATDSIRKLIRAQKNRCELMPKPQGCPRYHGRVQ